MRNIDSKVYAAGLDYFKFLFHRRHLATFATQSAIRDIALATHSEIKTANWCGQKQEATAACHVAAGLRSRDGTALAECIHLDCGYTA